MYHVISTGFTAILLYLISYILYRLGYYSLQLHRKFWNLILAIVFLSTAFAGIFIALQVNYKWNIPFIKELLRWHVEFGIGLTFTGLIHLIWHLNYYQKYFNKTPRFSENNNPPGLSSSEININLFIIGFVSSSIQFMMMKEIMNITGGYELIAGAFLGSWLIGSAAGASLAARSSLNDLRKINLIFSFSPLVSLFLMLFLSRIYLNPGETPSLLAAIIYTLLVLMPFCLVSGFTFIKLISIAGVSNNYTPGKSFSIETTGGIVSGIIISALTSGMIGTYKILLLIILMSLIYVLITKFTKRSDIKNIIKVSALTLSVIIIFFNPDKVFRQILLPAVKVIETKDTPYGNITEGIYKGEKSLYYNQRLLAYNDDATEREEDIHYAMLQSDNPGKVLLISGWLKSHLPEILKYPVSSITYIERDPFLAGYDTPVGDKYPDKVAVLNKDAFRFIKSSDLRFDVIILLIPPPTTLLLNRFYTHEFFYEVKKRLNPEGIFMCSPGPGDNYLNKEALSMYSSIFNSLSGIFKNVIPVVGNKMYLIASDKPLSLAFCKLVEKRNIKNVYVSSDFLEDDIISKKSEEVSRQLDQNMQQNRSAFPVACFHSQSYQFSKSLDEKIPAIILMILVFVLPVTAIRRRNLLMYFSASALAGFEIIILLTLQIMVGNMYQLTGLIIAGLMAGLSVGSGINLRMLNTISLRNKVIFLLIFYTIFGYSYNYILEPRSGILSVIVMISVAFFPALITGRVFRELNIISEGITASPSIYSADLAGSALGFIFISGFAVPVFGIQVSVYLLSGLILGGILFGTIDNKY